MRRVLFFLRASLKNVPARELFNSAPKNEQIYTVSFLFLSCDTVS